MTSMIFFGWAVGGPLYGWVSDKMGLRKIPMIFATVSTLVVLALIMTTHASPFQMKGLMFLLGAFSSGFIIAFSVVREINSPLLIGTAIGFTNTLNNASGALAQPIIGILLDRRSDGTLMADGNPFYSVGAYNEALLFLPICILIALIMMAFIQETFCQPIKQKSEKRL